MAFILKQSNSYQWPVKLRIPVDGGKKEISTFDCEFKRVSDERISALRKLARDIELGRVEEDEIDEKAIVREVMVGWSGVVDDEGQVIAFSQSTLDQLLLVATVPNQVLRAFFESLMPEEKPGKRKNY